MFVIIILAILLAFSLGGLLGDEMRKRRIKRQPVPPGNPLLVLFYPPNVRGKYFIIGEAPDGAMGAGQVVRGAPLAKTSHVITEIVNLAHTHKIRPDRIVCPHNINFLGVVQERLQARYDREERKMQTMSKEEIKKRLRGTLKYQVRFMNEAFADLWLAILAIFDIHKLPSKTRTELLLDAEAQELWDSLQTKPRKPRKG